MNGYTPSEMARIGHIIETGNKAGERLGQSELPGIAEVQLACETAVDLTLGGCHPDSDFIVWVLASLLKQQVAHPEVVQMEVAL